MDKTWDGKNRRSRWRRLKLTRKMPIIIAIPTVALMIAISTISFLTARSALTNQRNAEFDQLLTEKSDSLQRWIDTITEDAIVLATGVAAQDAVVEFSADWKNLGSDPGDSLQRLYITDNPNKLGEKDLLMQADDGSAWSATHARFHPGFQSFQRNHGFYDLFLFDLQGNVVYTVFKERDFGTNVLTGPWSKTSLAEVFRAASALPQGQVYISDFAPYAPSADIPAGFVATPIFSATGEKIGVAGLQIPVDEIGRIISNSTLLGETGQIYAVGPDGKARSGSTKEGGHKLLDVMPNLPQIAAAKKGTITRLDKTPGISGNDVVAHSTVFSFFGTEWHIVLEQDLTEANSAANRLLTMALMQAAIVMAIVTALAYWTAHSLTRRITALSNSVGGIAKGDLSSLVNEAKTGDEIGEIARALEKFKVELSQGRVAVQARESAAVEQSKVLADLGSALARLAEGELDCQIPDQFPLDYEELRRSFNQTIAALAVIIGSMKRNADMIDADVRKLGEASENLSRRTENQAATLEQTTAAMDEITSSVNQTAGGARDIVETTKKAHDQAKSGEQISIRTMDAMVAIQESAQQIGNIVQLIEDIAFQTNLLALNAGVEAARAGKVGLGFAVVASEVRALSVRSSESAAEIRSLISKSGANVSKGVALVSDMRTAIEDILAGVSQVTERITDIANGAAEQASGLSEINTGIVLLDKVTQENAAMVDESAAFSRALQQKIGDMRSLMAKFRGMDRSPAFVGGGVVGIGLAASGSQMKEGFVASAFPAQKTA